MKFILLIIHCSQLYYFMLPLLLSTYTQHTHTSIDIVRYVCIHTHLYMYIHTVTYAGTCIDTTSQAHIQMHIQMCTHTTFVHAHSHSDICFIITYAHTYTCTYAYTHMCSYCIHKHKSQYIYKCTARMHAHKCMHV